MPISQYLPSLRHRRLSLSQLPDTPSPCFSSIKRGCCSSINQRLRQTRIPLWGRGWHYESFSYHLHCDLTDFIDFFFCQRWWGCCFFSNGELEFWTSANSLTQGYLNRSTISRFACPTSNPLEVAGRVQADSLTVLVLQSKLRFVCLLPVRQLGKTFSGFLDIWYQIPQLPPLFMNECPICC